MICGLAPWLLLLALITPCIMSQSYDNDDYQLDDRKTMQESSSKNFKLSVNLHQRNDDGKMPNLAAKQGTLNVGKPDIIIPVKHCDACNQIDAGFHPPCQKCCKSIFEPCKDPKCCDMQGGQRKAGKGGKAGGKSGKAEKGKHCAVCYMMDAGFNPFCNKCCADESKPCKDPKCCDPYGDHGRGGGGVGGHMAEEWDAEEFRKQVGGEHCLACYEYDAGFYRPCNKCCRNESPPCTDPKCCEGFYGKGGKGGRGKGGKGVGKSGKAGREPNCDWCMTCCPMCSAEPCEWGRVCDKPMHKNPKCPKQEHLGGGGGGEGEDYMYSNRDGNEIDGQEEGEDYTYNNEDGENNDDQEKGEDYTYNNAAEEQIVSQNEGEDEDMQDQDK